MPGDIIFHHLNNFPRVYANFIVPQSLLKCHDFAKYTLAYITIWGDSEKVIVWKRNILTRSASCIEEVTQEEFYVTKV